LSITLDDGPRVIFHYQNITSKLVASLVCVRAVQKESSQNFATMLFLLKIIKIYTLNKNKSRQYFTITHRESFSSLRSASIQISAIVTVTDAVVSQTGINLVGLSLLHVVAIARNVVSRPSAGPLLGCGSTFNKGARQEVDDARHAHCAPTRPSL